MRPLRVFMLSGFILIAGTGNTVHALDWQTLWQRPDQVAYKKLQDGDTGAAAEIFDDPQWRGVSRYRAGEFDVAQKEFSSLAGETGLYNQAVTAVQQGDYDSAIEKFESLLSRNGDHPDAKHNLEIARELARQQQEQQEQEKSDQDQQSEEQQEQDQKDQPEGGGSSSDSESASDETGNTESSDEQNGGDLTTSPEDAAQQQSQTSAAQSDEQASEQGEQAVAEQPETDAGESQDNENTVPVSAAPSESEQATEQWLRRIPDDPSQLLRNKIKLNHMIEHADVQDMRMAALIFWIQGNPTVR